LLKFSGREFEYLASNFYIPYFNQLILIKKRRRTEKIKKKENFSRG